MLHLARTGLATFPGTPEIRDSTDIDFQGTVAVLERHRSKILGIKVRAVGAAVRTMGVDLIKLAQSAGAEGGTGIMVHIGDPVFRVEPTLTRQLLPLLQPGDIVSHLFTGAPGKVLDSQNRVLPELLEARDKGVIFDIGHGRFNMDFEVAKRLLDQNVEPFNISTDITLQGRNGIVKCMTHTMNEFLALGYSLTEVIRMSTYNPANIIGQQEELGTLAEGTTADLTILESVTGDWSFVDSQGQKIRGTIALRPVLCFRDGNQFSLDYGPFPWGWLPNPQH